MPQNTTTINTDVYFTSDGQTIKEENPWKNFKISGYNSKPKLDPLGKSQWEEFFGVELEVELKQFNGDEDHKKAGFLTNQILNPDKNNPFVVIKYDGSLTSGGFELCSSPASLEEHQVRWNNFFKNTPENLTILSTCGMHVHISREPLSTMQIGKIVDFVHNPENAKFIETIAGRASNNYSNYSDKKTSKFAMPKYSSNFAHYSAVNLKNSSTIEIRIFKATLDEKIFFKNLEFCHSLVKYAFPSKNSLVESRNYLNFVKFVETNYKTYPNLYDFLVEKGFLKKNPKKEKNVNTNK